MPTNHAYRGGEEEREGEYPADPGPGALHVARDRFLAGVALAVSDFVERHGRALSDVFAGELAIAAQRGVGGAVVPTDVEFAAFSQMYQKWSVGPAACGRGSAGSL